MPIYCYKCFDCGHYKEIKQKFDDKELTICPECGKDKFKRIIRNVGIIFKGKGFHVTDYGGNKATSPSPQPQQPVSAPKTEDSASKGESGDKQKPAQSAPATSKSGE